MLLQSRDLFWDPVPYPHVDGCAVELLKKKLILGSEYLE